MLPKLRIVINGETIQSLGPLERKVLAALQRIHATVRGCASIEMIVAVLDAGDTEAAYSTVATILARLAAKNLVDRHQRRHRHRHGGHQHWCYRARYSVSEVDQATLRTVVSALVATYGTERVVAAVATKEQERTV